MSISLPDLQDIIVALATPQGEGAIGVIRLSGNKAIDLCNNVFHGKDLAKEKTHTLHFGTIRKENEIIDEVVVSLFKCPKSYTGEDVVEISCHGSPYIIRSLVELFMEKGARLARPGEFTMRAFLNGKMDLSQAEAVADLIAADSKSAHDTALQQMRGGYSNEIQHLREELINFASMVELELDFGEEDVEFANRDQLVSLVNTIKKVLRQLLDSFQLGNAIKNGVTTVIAGRPNAGKSTLLNALLNEERAIVSEIPGTTRDTIEEIININGILFRLIDTAGIRDAADKIEFIGVEKTMQKIRQSALVVYLFDVNELSATDLRADLEKLDSKVPVLLVGNKIDKISARQYKMEFVNFGNVIFISSLEKANLDKLKQQLQETVFAEGMNRESTIITNARHYEALKNADQALSEVLEGIHQQISGELLALDIRRALDHLGAITGAIDIDKDILGTIFGKFCIGK